MTRVSANEAIGYVLVLLACVVMFSTNRQCPPGRLGVRRRVCGPAGRAGAAALQAALRDVPRRSITGRRRGNAAERCADFRANWSGRPLSDLVDKIHKTMPFEAPGSLSRQQAIDLTALVLQAGKFPSGRGELSEGALAGVRLPTVRASAAPVAASSGALPPPVGNLAELMRAIAFYNSNIVFNTPVRNPANAPKKPMPVPFDYVEWGYTIYTGWLTVDQAAVALTETAHLLSTPGRRCQNGRPVPCGTRRLEEIRRRPGPRRQGPLRGIEGPRLRKGRDAERHPE